MGNLIFKMRTGSWNKLRGILPTLFLIITMGCSEHQPSSPDLERTPSEPELFAEGLISTSLYERDLAISPDGREVIFTRGTHDQRIRALVSFKMLENDSWSSPEVLPFCGTYQDIEPFFSPDGNRLFFASNRPMDRDSTRTDYNIWVVNRSEKGWGEPVALDTLVNTTADEFYPAVSANESLYFTSSRSYGTGREDIFVSRFSSGKYLSPVVLDSTVNTSAYEFNAYVDPEETLLIFSSYGRDDGYGGGDLYFSRKTDSGYWSQAVNMGPLINSEFLDFCPFVDIPNGNLYFSSDRKGADQTRVKTIEGIREAAEQTLNGFGNIYRIGIEHSPIKKGL